MSHFLYIVVLWFELGNMYFQMLLHIAIGYAISFAEQFSFEMYSSL